MRPTIASAVLILAAIAARPAPASAERTWRGVTTVGVGMRGNQGGVLTGGFRFIVATGFMTPKVRFLLELDRQMGPDNRIENADLQSARWNEWVAAVRAGRQFRLTRGLSLVTNAGVALVHASVIAPRTEMDPTLEIERYNLGVDGQVTMMWRANRLLVVLTGGATVVPFAQEVEVRDARYELPTRAEPWGNLGVGFTY